VSAAARVLDRLARPRQTRPGNWVAACPCCQSRRGRPISVREVDDRVLIHAFCGCSTESVIDALGLRTGDLFDRHLSGYQGFGPSHTTIPARDLLVLLDHEIAVAVLILVDVITRRTANESQIQRLMQASARIGQARDLAAPQR
jgi:hypothetical protein